MIGSLNRHRILAAAILSLTLSASFAPGTAMAAESDDWEFRITPYLWLMGLEGTTAVLGQDADVDASFSDILDRLNIALSANMELSKGKFFIVFDPLYAQLEADFAGPIGGPVAGTVDVDMVIADLNVGYSFDENFGIYAGARHYDQDITLTANLVPQQSLGDNWTDFIVGLRAGGEVSENWSIMGKLDAAVGGDSESAWYFQAVLLRHFGTNKHLNLGWRYYDVDYESGTGITRFKWDVAHSGPVVGFSWEFGG
jgi:hypothetical protein